MHWEDNGTMLAGELTWSMTTRMVIRRGLSEGAGSSFDLRKA